MTQLAAAVFLTFCGVLAVSCAKDASGGDQRSPAQASVCGDRKATIYFGSWESELDDVARAEIDALQKTLANCGIERVSVTGMAGAPGGAAANEEVSRKRAENVASALTSGGWPSAIIEISAIGADGATLPDGGEAAMRRRVEIEVKATVR